jgi:hypothetical protein
MLKIEIKMQTIMKRTTITIMTLGLLAILLCGLIFYTSCRSETECSGCKLTNEQIAIICYTQGQKVIFKNDSTNILDTLNVVQKYYNTYHCSSPCNGGYGEVGATLTFSHLTEFSITIYAQPKIIASFGDNNNNFPFFFGNTQTVTVNSTTYNDVYSVQTDSTRIISFGYQQKVPWKIYFSKANGFVRFYMTSGQTWSKL